MNDRLRKSWTVLIYADGNNEMEEVVYRSLKNLRNIGELRDINVVIEIGLLGADKTNKNKWCGVRRYYIDLLEPTFIEDLGRVNMADPNNLYNFIEWGIKNYPASHYMIILSGHGAGFVGGFTDIGLQNNYIMGISQMSKAVGKGAQAANSSIDILVLDMCFMNSIEVLYEFAQQEFAVKRIIAYTDFAPYEGLDYKKLIKLMKINSGENDISLFIKNLISNLDFQLVAYELDKRRWDSVKKMLSDLAFLYLKHREVNERSISKLGNENIMELDLNILDKINDELQSAVIYSSTEFLGINSSIKIKCEDISNMMHFYDKLAFSKNNYWKYLLSSIPISNKLKRTDKVKVRTADSTVSTVHYILDLNG
jgi:hypothetical protein